ncbi:hypothetical protein CCACVL1_04841 [Corchorus capsularis]|uniref:Uncharacterized protein n=1 Tax=Corchorus capsularis TaxID=210143 RepID=A0A1R3JPP5_COCAP|nr:hypothetical protein CCACVL1_04841 [Corchorus capsularis]
MREAIELDRDTIYMAEKVERV